MARVVMVHGAGNELWGPSSIKARWLPALADGLAHHGVDLDPADVRIAFYGDLFRPDPESGYVPDVDPAGAVASIEDLVKGIDPTVDLQQLTQMLTEHHLDRLLAQASAYFDDPELRTGARARVEAAIGPDTEVVVAHSLGTVVTYETLCAHPEWTVTDLVTIGCPLGGEIIFDRLEPAPTAGRGAWPGSVQAWTNITGRDDPAASTPLEGKFDGPVVDRRVDNGHRVHDPEPYLNNPHTGAAVATALGRPR